MADKEDEGVARVPPTGSRLLLGVIQSKKTGRWHHSIELFDAATDKPVKLWVRPQSWDTHEKALASLRESRNWVASVLREGGLPATDAVEIT